MQKLYSHHEPEPEPEHDFEIFIFVFLVYGLLCELGIGCISSISLFVINEAVFFLRIRVAKWFIEDGQRFPFLFWVACSRAVVILLK